MPAQPARPARAASVAAVCSSLSGMNCAASAIARRFVDVEVDVRLDRLVVGVGRVADVDEQRAGQRRVRAVRSRLGRRRDAAGAGVDLERLQGVGVLLVVGVAEVAHGALGAGDTLGDDVVVLGGLVVGARGTLFTVDHVGEVVEGAGVGAGTEEGQLLVGEARVDLVPVGDLARRHPRSRPAGRSSGSRRRGRGARPR